MRASRPGCDDPAFKVDRRSMAAGSHAAATLTRPSLCLLYSNFREPEFDIADYRLATRCQGVIGDARW
jgi:hypothetical protein